MTVIPFPRKARRIPEWLLTAIVAGLAGLAILGLVMAIFLNGLRP